MLQEPEHAEVPAQIPTRASGWPARSIRLPKRYRDELPPAPPPIPTNDSEPEIDVEEQVAAFVVDPQETYEYCTEPDSYGVLREYSQGKPSITPDEHYSLTDVVESPYLALDPSDSQPCTTSHFASPLQKFCSQAANTSTTTIETIPNHSPFRNMSIFRIMTWFYGSSGVKSLFELNSLIKDVILAPDFKTEDFIGFDAKKEHKVMDGYRGSSSEASPFAFDDSWIKGSVEIPLPCDGVQQSEAEAPRFVIEVYHRKLLDIIKAALGEPSAERFHIFPFRAFWQPGPDEAKERIYFEIYTGDCWNEEYTKIHVVNHQQGLHRNFEHFLLVSWFGQMRHCWHSLETRSYGQYIYILEISPSTPEQSLLRLLHIMLLTYQRCIFFRSFLLNHLFWVQLDDRIQEFYMEAFGKAATAAMLTHLRRELVQAIWILLLDDEFMHAYIHGFLFQLADGIQRVLFPRFMTYSADYPEK